VLRSITHSEGIGLKIHRIILILFGLLFIVGTTTAADLTPSTMTSSNTGWIVANANDQSTITVHVVQASPVSDVAGATVTFSLADDSQNLGSLSTQNAVTGTDGIAQTVFRTKTKSGTATINALVSYNDGTATTTIPLSCIQHIDHDTPYSADITYAHDVVVGSVTPVTIRLLDSSNNPADNKNPAAAHTVVLYTSGDGGSGFVEGAEHVQDLSLPTDAEGAVSVDFLVSTLSGPNTFQVYPIGSYLGEPITINGVADRNPSYLVQNTIYPESYPADGKDPDHRFTFYYTVQDKYKNPMKDVTLRVTSSNGEEVSLITDSGGMNFTHYGPKDVAGVYTITATPVIAGTITPLNPAILCTGTQESGFCSQTVEYTSMDPVDMILTASPQTMVSMDVAGAKAVEVRAKVVDIAGNGVKDQTVTFEKSADSYSPFTETSQSSLSSVSITTGDTGYATVSFIPGTFAKKGQTGYNDAATGSCKVTARWVNTKGETRTQEITFVWKNYPFLTVESEIDKTDAKVGDTINVKVWIRGTGAALQPKPIDVVLVLDRSGSMKGARMTSAKSAANKFIEQMKKGNGNQVGLVSFASSTTLDQSLTVDYDAVKTKVSNLNADGATQMRRALYEAITDVRTNGGSDTVKAVILLTDGDWNYDGTPLAKGRGFPGTTSYLTWPGNVPNFDSYEYYSEIGGGTSSTSSVPVPDGSSCHYYNYYTRSCDYYVADYVNRNRLNYAAEFTSQNMSVYANSSAIRLYVLSFEDKPSDTVQAALSIMTKGAIGFYQHAPSETDLNNLYTQIAGDLNVQAGGQTQLVTDLSTITVDGKAVTGDTVGEYLEYVYNPSGVDSSTFITKYSTQPVTPPKNDYYVEVRDDRGNWTNPTMLPGLTSKKLEFSVGKIILDDVWMTNIQFRLKKAGVIGIFGENSPVTFIDANTKKSQTVTVPMNSTNVHETKVDNPFSPSVRLDVTNMKITGGTTDPNLWTVSWDTTYDGTGIVHEKLLYCADPCSATAFGLRTVYPGSIGDKMAGTTSDSISVDTSSWKPGSTYRLTVWAESYGEKENWGEDTHVKEDGSQKNYIKLE